MGLSPTLRAEEKEDEDNVTEVKKDDYTVEKEEL